MSKLPCDYVRQEYKNKDSAQAAQVNFSELLAIARLEQNKLAEWILLGQLAHILAYNEKFLEALQVFEAATQIWNEENFKRLKGIWMGAVGSVHIYLGNLDLALQMVTQGLDILKLYEDYDNMVFLLVELGCIYERRGEEQKGITILNEAIVLAQKVQNKSEEIQALLNLGLWLVELNRFSEAISVNEKAIALSMGHGNLLSKIGLANLRLGIVYESLNELRKALDLYQKAYNIYSQWGSLYNQSACCGNIAGLWEALEDLPAAMNYYKRALDIDMSFLPPDHEYILTGQQDIFRLQYRINNLN